MRAYTVFPHVAGRIDRFMTGEAIRSRSTWAVRRLIHGGWFGVGPGEGTVKRVIPDSHADFVFAVAGEEFGIICFSSCRSFAFIVLRGLTSADATGRFHALCALPAWSSCSACSRSSTWRVNLQLMPAKGMTLPFISYGGSSLIAIAVSMGMVLALTRKRPKSASSHGLCDSCRRTMPAE